MTIEQSLRRRALRHQMVAYVVWFLVVLIVLVSAWLLPHSFHDVAKQAASLVTDKSEPSALGAATVGTIVVSLSFSAIVGLAWHLIRFAHGERTLAATSTALADALCLSGNDIDGFEKVLKILSPPQTFIAPENEPDRSKELTALANLVKTLR